ncbi:MAG: alcohol dehydrogenase catalytic domain-containing protein [Smithella sp.]|jgi:2-desacetyl-2-hydroxyethyl bacteriochlorophyllide A dehydrogenase
MNAVVFRKDRGLVYEEVPDYQVAADEVLVKVANTGFCGSDHSLVAGGLLPDGYIIGHEISAVVVEKGAKAFGPDVGTRVCIRPTYCGKCANCLEGKPHLCRVHRRTAGIGDLSGGFAQYVKVYPQMLIPVPQGVDSRNAALAETFASALHAINCTGDKMGSALVMGGGPIGLSAVRILKILGYGPIVLFEPVKSKREIAILYGADHAFDPHEKDVDQQVMSIVPGGFHKTFECSGVKANVDRAIQLAADGGQVCIVSMIFTPLTITAPFLLNLKEVRLMASYSNTHAENIQCLNWMAEGKLDARPLVSDYEPLERLPAVYQERINTGLALKVLLKIGEEF